MLGGTLRFGSEIFSRWLCLRSVIVIGFKSSRLRIFFRISITPTSVLTLVVVLNECRRFDEDVVGCGLVAS